MKLKLSFFLLAALPNLCFALETLPNDTVKVIDNPNQIVIMEKYGEVLLNVKGSKADADYLYEYRVEPKSRWRVSTWQREGNEVEFQHPFKKCDSINYRPHFILFMSDLYFGFGSNTVDGLNRDAFGKTVSEAGILNLIGLGYLFNHRRSQLSIGVGFNWTNYHLRKPNFFIRSDNGVLGVENFIGDLDKHYSSLTVRSMQFPLMYNQSLGKKWNLTTGVIFNWNYYADFGNSYSQDMSNYSVTTHGLHQRKVAFDYLGMVSWHGLGLYFRYAPQSVLKAGFGPEMKNRWTVGLALRGGW